MGATTMILQNEISISCERIQQERTRDGRETGGRTKREIPAAAAIF